MKNADFHFGINAHMLYEYATKNGTHSWRMATTKLSDNQVKLCRATLLTCISRFDEVLRNHGMSWGKNVVLKVPGTVYRSGIKTADEGGDHADA